MTGEGPTYQERQKERVECGDSRKEMAAESLTSHQMTQHGKDCTSVESWNKSATGVGETQTYWIYSPTKEETREYPVEGCPGRAGTRTAMRVTFWRRHIRDIVIILKEGNFQHSG